VIECSIVCVVIFIACKMGYDEKPPFEDKGLNNWANQLWDADVYRLIPDQDYDLDPQGRARFSKDPDGPDMAADPFFERVDPAVFKKPTYKAFVSLLDNYASATGETEVVTDQEVKENWNFINLCFSKKVFELCYKYLKFKGKVTKSPSDFKEDLYDMWFKMYKRDYKTRGFDSSGFEHVFVGETREKTDEVIGFHNWIQFYLQEKAGKVDYKGFMASDRNPHLMAIQFSWKGEVKPKGSMFIGTSPEFEMALYTTLFMMGHPAYKINLGGEDVIIKCHQSKGKIGTCFPQLPRWERRK